MPISISEQYVFEKKLWRANIVRNCKNEDFDCMTQFKTNSTLSLYNLYCKTKHNSCMVKLNFSFFYILLSLTFKLRYKLRKKLLIIFLQHQTSTFETPIMFVLKKWFRSLHELFLKIHSFAHFCAIGNTVGKPTNNFIVAINNKRKLRK